MTQAINCAALALKFPKLVNVVLIALFQHASAILIWYSSPPLQVGMWLLMRA